MTLARVDWMLVQVLPDTNVSLYKPVATSQISASVFSISLYSSVVNRRRLISGNGAGDDASSGPPSRMDSP
jgi:hypothetical protein